MQQRSDYPDRLLAQHGHLFDEACPRRGIHSEPIDKTLYRRVWQTELRQHDDIGVLHHEPAIERHDEFACGEGLLRHEYLAKRHARPRCCKVNRAGRYVP